MPASPMRPALAVGSNSTNQYVYVAVELEILSKHRAEKSQFANPMPMAKIGQNQLVDLDVHIQGPQNILFIPASLVESTVNRPECHAPRREHKRAGIRRQGVKMIADRETIRDGVADHREHRVLEMDWDQELL